MSWRRYYGCEVGTSFTDRNEPIRHLRVWKWNEKDGISWDTLQQIKNEVVGEDVVMVEVYPAANDMVFLSNMRHLWEMPAGVPFGLHTRFRAGDCRNSPACARAGCADCQRSYGPRR